MRNKMRNKKPKSSKYTIRFLDSTNRSILFLWQVAEDYAFVSNYEVQGDSEFVSYPDNAGIRDADRTPPWLFDFGGLKRYPPLKDPTLHRTFGELEDSEEAITSFARKYGLLGKPVVLHPKGSKGSYITTGESLARWRTEILEMGLSLAIWDLIQDKNTRELNKIIEWPHSNYVKLNVVFRREDGHYRFFDWDTHLKTDAGVAYRFGPLVDYRALPELLQRWCQGDVLEPALFYLCREIERKWKGQIDLRLLLTRAPLGIDLYMAPGSLLTAMWLMFMWEVTGNIKVFWCPGCGQWKERFDSRQQTCSHACKQRMYRKNLQRRGIEHKQGQEGGTQ